VGQFCKHRAACFLFPLLKTETATWHLRDYPAWWENTPDESNEFVIRWYLLKSAPDQRTYSTEIPHARVATSRFNAYQALQLYTKTSKISSPLAHFLHIIPNEIYLISTHNCGYIAQKQA
jgi:hypothetical protein